LIRLSKGICERVVAEAAEGYPYETCGLLVGYRKQGTTSVLEAVRAANINLERRGDRYQLDPKTMHSASRRASGLGLDIVGIWHSHPDYPAHPSEADRVAAWTGWSYVIVSVMRTGLVEIRSWRIEKGQFEEEEIAS
jgi:proteasome lid subunit RPN8/RPN11